MADLPGGVSPFSTFDGSPDNRWGASEVQGGTFAGEDFPDSRWGAFASFQTGGGSSTTSVYLMRALATSNSATVLWQSTNSPDYTGTSAPVSVQVSTIVLLRKLS